ncbi:MAG: MMPL family transporter [Prevotella sp.]|nr:MMPL family transporter [Prevotella sp.]
MVLLFVVTGYGALCIHLEEDLNKLMPSSRNADGSIKTAFADLRIKDKTYLLFEMNGNVKEQKSKAVSQLINTCEVFSDSLLARDTTDIDIFRSIPDDMMFEGVSFLIEHLPAYIDTSAYAKFDTLLTPRHLRAQQAINASDKEKAMENDDETGELLSSLIDMDPIGMRDILAKQMEPLMSTGGKFITIDGHFFVPDSTVCVAFISPAFSSTNTGQGSALFEHLNSLIDNFSKTHPGVKISYYGTPASGYYNSSTIKNDLVSTVGWSMLIVLLVLFICMRTWNTIPLLMLPVVFGTLFGLSIMYLVRGQFSLLALGLGAIVLGVAMSYVLHIIIHYKYTGDAEKVIRDETVPVLLGCITTIGSFMGLIFIKTDLLQDFGLFAALAIIGTTVFSLVYLPHLMEMEGNKINKRAFAVVDKFNNYPLDTKKPLLYLIGIFIVVFVTSYVIKGTDFDADMSHLGYLSPNTEYAEHLLDAKTTPAGGLTDSTRYFAAQGKTSEEALQNFSLLQAKIDSLQKLGLVKDYTHTNSIFVPLTQQKERIDAWKAFWTPERINKVRPFIPADSPFYELVESEYLPTPLYDIDIIPPGYQSTLMEQTMAGDWLIFTNVSMPRNLKTYTAVCDAIANEPNMLVLDTNYYTKDGLTTLNSDFNVLQWVSMAFVFVVLLLSFRFNWCYALLGFSPILISWLIVLGAMALFGIRFNLINIIISTFIFGIGVDYSIFIMSGLIGEKNNTSSHMLAFHKTAILFSAFILITTVASMLLAQHPALQSVGFATLVGMISAVALSYILQPAVFRWLKK